MLADDPSNRAEPSAVGTMLDRPVAHIATFVAMCLAFWVRALLHPWRAGRAVLDDPMKGPPPFAWLVTTLFVAGIALRLFFAIEAVPPSASPSLLSDLRTALGDVSLTGAVLTTLPCVLIIALPAITIGRFLGRQRDREDQPLVTAVCHALGWQFGLVTLFMAAMIAMQLAGMEPTGQLNDELNAAFPYAGAFAIAWGALILSPAIYRLTETNVAISTGSGLLITGPLIVIALWTLGQSVDLQGADRIAEARKLRDFVGDLHVKVLESQPLVNGLGKERHRLKVVYTNLSDRLLIVSREAEFAPREGVSARRLRVVESSLDFLPDRALLIQPGETRLAEYTVEPQPGLIGMTLGGVGNLAYRLPFHRREADGGFLEGEAALHAPRETALPRIGQTPSLRR